MAIYVSGDQHNHPESGQKLEGRGSLVSAHLASSAAPAQRRRVCHVRWQRQPDAETGRELICILEIETGEIIAIVRSLFDVWLS